MEAMAMALRAAAAAVTRPPPSKPTAKPHPRPSSALLSPTPAALSFVAIFASPEAKAISFPKEDVVSSLTKVEDTVNQVGDASAKALDFTQSVIKILTDALEPAVDAALPVLRSAGEEILKIASPVVSDASKQATKALQSAGVDTGSVISAAKTVADVAQQTTKVIEGAKPLASTTVETIASSDPAVLVVSAGAAFLAYLLLPPLWSAVSFNFRGYKGNLSPAQTLDLVSSQNYVLIDVRSIKDKNKAGVPRLPNIAKSKMIAVPLEELPGNLKGLVRNVKKAEAEIAALKISYLKKVGKNTNIVIMDSYSDTAKLVAKALTGFGFKNCWIMTDGFSGGKGWLQSRLGTDSFNVSIAEVLSPSRIIPAAAARFGTTGSTRKLLPGSSES